MTDIDIKWKKITRGLPKTRRYADDRAPTIEEIQKISEYPDRRIKALVYTMASSGVKLSAWYYLRWGHIKPVAKNDGLNVCIPLCKNLPSLYKTRILMILSSFSIALSIKKFLCLFG